MILADEADARGWFASRRDFDAATLDRLERLEALLRAENAHQNLVSRSSLEALWVRHFADSAQLLDHVPRETGGGAPWLDLGSGAGFPGLVVAICQLEREVVLVESRAKRVAWLESAVDKLALPSVRVAATRLEKLETVAASVISARAFAPLAHLIALSARFSTPDTHWVLPKGRSGSQELREMAKSVRAMFHVKHSITDCESVILIGRGRLSQPFKARPR